MFIQSVQQHNESEVSYLWSQNTSLLDHILSHLNVVHNVCSIVMSVILLVGLRSGFTLEIFCTKIYSMLPNPLHAACTTPFILYSPKQLGMKKLYEASCTVSSILMSYFIPLRPVFSHQHVMFPSTV